MDTKVFDVSHSFRYRLRNNYYEGEMNLDKRHDVAFFEVIC